LIERGDRLTNYKNKRRIGRGKTSSSDDSGSNLGTGPIMRGKRKGRKIESSHKLEEPTGVARKSL